ncbi:hypothetical protein GCM10025868_18030 [Angustibacter aerolatus]|uniref:Na+/H+ antiporter NhaA n=1 Tax=Angustibacter aerolatus TaxID=1162965 RepID=A0ABQ6JGL6_9ACTN|nr:hypothetical protein GCM10025868_18030 [Angustibacter aerolatus]
MVGDLRDPARAALPVAAALCGVVVPALVYTAVVAGGDGQGLRGWAIPTATDIAFALGVLAVAGSGLPSALRSFLLTLAVVDDLVAITIIAIFYTSALDLPALLLALVPLALFGLLAQTRRGRWWSLLPLALTTWGLVHASGVHPTVAGVLLAFTVPVRRRPGEQRSPAERHEHTWRPVSAGFAVPAFALTASGVTLVGGGLGDAVRDRVALAVVAALVVGKFVGVLGGTWLVARLTRAEARRRPRLAGRRGAVAARRHRLHREPAGRRACRSATARRPTSTSRRGCWAGRCCRPCSPSWCCGCAPAPTGAPPATSRATATR